MDDVASAPHARLAVTVEPASGELLATFGGELDLSGTMDVADALDGLLGREPQPLLVDLADVGFLDSSGVSVLIRLANHFRPLRTRNATAPVQRVLEVLGLADHFGLQRG